MAISQLPAEDKRAPVLALTIDSSSKPAAVGDDSHPQLTVPTIPPIVLHKRADLAFVSSDGAQPEVHAHSKVLARVSPVWRNQLRTLPHSDEAPQIQMRFSIARSQAMYVLLHLAHNKPVKLTGVKVKDVHFLADLWEELAVRNDLMGRLEYFLREFAQNKSSWDIQKTAVMASAAGRMGCAALYREWTADLGLNFAESCVVLQDAAIPLLDASLLRQIEIQKLNSRVWLNKTLTTMEAKYRPSRVLVKIAKSKVAHDTIIHAYEALYRVATIFPLHSPYQYLRARNPQEPPPRPVTVSGLCLTCARKYPMTAGECVDDGHVV